MVDIEVLPAGQRVPRLQVLDIDGERAVSATPVLAPRPLRRGENRDRRSLNILERESTTLVVAREVRHRSTRALLELAEPLRA